MIRRRLIIMLVACLMAASAVPARTKDYIVGEDDVIRIMVYGHQDLSVTERVSGEGNITFPLIGSVRVSGLTVDQIGKLISDRLSEGFIVDPQISVFVTEYKSRKAIIMGQVQKPGIYMLSGPTTFLELLSMAGGISQDAGDRAIIKRKKGDGDKGETLVSHINTSLMARIFGGTVWRVMGGPVSRAEHAMLRGALQKDRPVPEADPV